MRSVLFLVTRSDIDEFNSASSDLTLSCAGRLQKHFHRCQNHQMIVIPIRLVMGDVEFDAEVVDNEADETDEAVADKLGNELI